ncbi:hypothetical protein C0J52_01361 [Blattella germanica]|nr:hypothetical protein C0J52_01361 [Blattella germanica]
MSMYYGSSHMMPTSSKQTNLKMETEYGCFGLEISYFMDSQHVAPQAEYSTENHLTHRASSMPLV